MDSSFLFNWFKEFETLQKNLVLFGNNRFCKIVGVGTTEFDLKIERMLDEVRFVPNLKYNLISLDEL